jgi:hypothetical protein
MAGPAERRLRRATGDRNWSTLAPGTQRRWIGNSGGPRTLPPAERRRRAQLAYEAGARLAPEHTGHGPKVVGEFAAVATTQGIMEVSGDNWRERNRLGRFSGDSAALMAGEISDEEFAKRWRRRVGTVGDVELETDPRRVRAMWAVYGPAPQPFYRRRARQAG